MRFLAASFASTCLFLAAACASSGSPDPASGTVDGGADGATGPSETTFSDAACSDGFCWVRPLPQGNTLYAVATLADGEAWAVGAGGTVLRRRDGTWRVAATITGATLRGVFAASRDDVWIVGGTGTVLHYDGKTLEKRASGTEAALYAVTAFSRSDAWIVGEGGTILHYDGKTIAKASGGADELHAIWGSGPNDVWAAGGTANVGTIAHYDGSRWSSRSSGLAGAGWNAISGTSANDVWLAGNYGRVGHYDGEKWTEHPGALGNAPGNAVVAIAPNEAYFSAGGRLFGHYDGAFHGFEIDAGNGIARDTGGELLFVGDRGAVRRGIEERAVDEIAAPNEEVVAVTSDDHVVVLRGPYGASRLVDLTSGRETPVPPTASLLTAEDGAVLAHGENLSYPGEVAFSYARDGRFVDVPTPGDALGKAPNGEGWYDTSLVAARTADDVWFVGMAKKYETGTPAAALVHYAAGRFVTIPLPSECLGQDRSFDTFEGAIRPLPDGALLSCDCLATRIRGDVMAPPTRWTCDYGSTRDDGYVSVQKKKGIYLDGDAILVARVVNRYLGERGGFNSYEVTPVVDRIANGKRERLVLPDGVVSIESTDVTIERSPSGRPWVFLGEAEGRAANLLEVDGTTVRGRLVPMGTIAATFATRGGVYLSNGSGLMRSR